jgi:diguanylate cyclase (GGDEF)-like protein
MKHFKIELRLALSALFLAVGISTICFVFFYFQSLRHMEVAEISSLLGTAETKNNLTVNDLYSAGIYQEDLLAFTKNSTAMEQGFFVTQGAKTDILLVKKQGPDRFLYVKQVTGFQAWAKGMLLPAGGFALGVSLASFLVLFTLSKLSLNPLSDLRRTMEDILAGRFEVKSRYGGSDDVGLSFEALRRLCVELEKKDKALESVSELATTDGMTGLKNHRAFKEEFVRQISLAVRHGHDLSFIMMDVDHFKKFNDSYGHQQGDEVLRAVAKSLMATARNTDFVARYGGEEFVAILPQTDLKGAGEAAEKLRKAIEATKVQYLAQPGQVLSVTASFGVLTVSGKSLEKKAYEPGVFVEPADQNLYIAKKQGRNRVVVSQFLTQQKAA